MSSSVVAQLPTLRVADNNRFLVDDEGKPFVWIGDTNWFFAKLPPTTIEAILDKRQAQGFTIMLVSCREQLYNGKGGPGRPGNPNETWWAYLDEYVKKCDQRGLYVGLTLGWHNLLRSSTKEELFTYGKWVGDRYRNQTNVIWLTLGEAGGHQRKKALDQGKLTALIDGIRAGDSGNKLLTVHADFRRGSSLSSIAEKCDFNNWQSSQWKAIADLPRLDDRDWTAWEAIQYDYGLRYQGQPKPTIDAEAWYENNKDFCGATAFNVRRRAYFTVFAGAMGHNYGAGGIWDGLIVSEGCSADALGALSYPGGTQMGYLSRLLRDLGAEWLDLRPSPGMVKKSNSRDYDHHRQATISIRNNLALIYSADDRPYSIKVDGMRGNSLRFKWYNPRTGEWSAEKRRQRRTSITVDPPGDEGSGNDWVLVLRTSEE